MPQQLALGDAGVAQRARASPVYLSLLGRRAACGAQRINGLPVTELEARATHKPPAQAAGRRRPLDCEGAGSNTRSSLPLVARLERRQRRRRRRQQAAPPTVGRPADSRRFWRAQASLKRQLSSFAQPSPVQRSGAFLKQLRQRRRRRTINPPPTSEIRFFLSPGDPL